MARTTIPRAQNVKTGLICTSSDAAANYLRPPSRWQCEGENSLRRHCVAFRGSSGSVPSLHGCFPQKPYAIPFVPAASCVPAERAKYPAHTQAYIYVYIYITIYRYTQIREHTCIHTHVCILVPIVYEIVHVCVYIYTYVCVHVFSYVYVHMCVYIYLYVYMYIYIYIYIYLSLSLSLSLGPYCS